MDTMKIFDKDITVLNYANFKHCLIRNHGKSITFTLACGAEYDVPIEYFLKWNNHPHYVIVGEELIEWEKSIKSPEEEMPIFSKWWKVLSDTAVRVCLSNDAVYEIPWDTVLMACEKRYEHFGGLTNESRLVVSEWQEIEWRMEPRDQALKREKEEK
jgi:hypothetical protein